MTNLELAEKIKFFIACNFPVPADNASGGKFVTTLGEYVSHGASLSPEREMKELTQILYKVMASNHHYVKQEELLGSIKQRIAAIAEPVPKTMHFMPLSLLTDIEVEHIKIWRQSNRDYKITIWQDSRALLASELSQRLQEIAKRRALNAGDEGSRVFQELFKTYVIELQDFAYKTISSTKRDMLEFNFDQQIILFLEANGLARPGELEQIRQANEQSFTEGLNALREGILSPATIKIRDLNVLMQEFRASDNLYIFDLYIKELTLRGNRAAAIDIGRLLALEYYGGVYLDTGLLPHLNPVVFAEHFIDLANIGDQQIIADVITDVLTENRNRLEHLATTARGNRRNFIDIDRLQESTLARPARIKRIVINALERGNLFLSLGEQKVDPWLGYYCAEGESRIVVAKEGSLVMNRMLMCLKSIHEVINKHNIDGLTPYQLIPQTVTPALTKDLQSRGLLLNPDMLLSYRSVEGSLRASPATREIAGSSAYLYAHFQLLQEIGITPEKNRLWSLKNHEISPFTRAFPIEEAYLSLLSRVGMSRTQDTSASQSQYNSQYIIQLHDDPVTNGLASFLYNKRRDRSAWYNYHRSMNQLIEVKSTTNFMFQGKTRLVLIGHGTPMQATGGKKIVELIINASLLKKSKQGLFQPIERVSLVACNLTEGMPAPNAKNVLPPDSFISRLYNAFAAQKVPVQSISAREGLVSVDMMGRKWIGKVTNAYTPPTNRLLNGRG